MEKRRFMWEKELFDEFHSIVTQVCLIYDKSEEWLWGLELTSGFFTKSAYKFLVSRTRVGQQLHMVAYPTFKMLWNSKVPHKIMSFSWQLFLDRIPTKDTLLKRGVLVNLEDIKCARM